MLRMRVLGMLRMRRVARGRFAGIFGTMPSVLRDIVRGVMLRVMFGHMLHRLPLSSIFNRLINRLVSRLVSRLGRMPVMVVFTCHALTWCLRVVVIPVA